MSSGTKLWRIFQKNSQKTAKISANNNASAEIKEFEPALVLSSSNFSISVDDIPVPGMPIVVRFFPWPYVTCAPRTPSDVLMPDLLMLIVTPGAILMRLLNLKAILFFGLARVSRALAFGVCAADALGALWHSGISYQRSSDGKHAKNGA